MPSKTYPNARPSSVKVRRALRINHTAVVYLDLSRAYPERNLPQSHVEGLVERPEVPDDLSLEAGVRVVKEYPRLLRKGFTPFDPLQLARTTEQIVSREDARKYTGFYCTGVYGGISTGYAVGCCLRCIFCWVDFSRDFPEEHGEFYRADQVVTWLIENARHKRVARLRISGGEPTLCKRHLLDVLHLVEPTGYGFILETNGIPIAADNDYAVELARYTCAHIRVSLKAGTPEGFEACTGARGEFWDLPFVATERLLAAEADFHVAAMTDPRLMPQAERAAMLHRLRRAGYTGWVEEERCDAYPSTVKRLRAAGWQPS